MTYIRYIVEYWSGSEFSISILHGPESMLPHCTQKFTWLLILWQLLLPSGAPWLHTVVDGSCCTTPGEQHSKTTCCHQHHSHESDRDAGKACSSHKHRDGQLSCGEQAPFEGQSPANSPPHDCTNCAICQAISAPRVLTGLVELPKIAEQIGVIETPECADPLLGFCLPLKCRAPPAA